MIHLKTYNEEFNLKHLLSKDRKIHSICKKYRIKNYTINSDGSIDVDGYVDLSHILKLDGKFLDKLPIKFRNVSGYFDCGSNQLTSLEGCPKRVGGDFDCSHNQITSLVGSPSSVGGSFICHDNQITSLVGSPSSVGISFMCRDNQITSFDGCSRHIGTGHFYCHNNPISVVWRLFQDYSKLEFFQDCDIIRDDKVIILDRLNYFLEEIGKPTVDEDGVKGYKCI